MPVPRKRTPTKRGSNRLYRLVGPQIVAHRIATSGDTLDVTQRVEFQNRESAASAWDRLEEFRSFGNFDLDKLAAASGGRVE